MPSIVDLKREELTEIRAFWVAYEPQREQVSLAVMEAVLAIPEFAVIMKAMTPEQQREQDQRSIALQRAAIVDGKWEPYLSDLGEQGARYAHMGIRFEAWFELVAAFRRGLVPAIARHYGEDREKVMSALLGADRFVDIAMAGIGAAYLATKERIIAEQNAAIREISTPVLQVRERMLILPVIGMVDTHRARQLTQSLLENISGKRARVVVMDVTGVPIVDSKVANHFIQTVEAAKLMGATVLITGVSPQIAQTLVTIGANLEGVRTLCDLQEGIEEGERLLAVAVGEPARAPASAEA